MGFVKRIISMVSIFVMISLLFTGCTNFNLSKNEYIATINGEEVSVGEFKVYLWKVKQVYQDKGEEDIWETSFDGKSAEEVAKERALDSIKTFIIQVQKAKEVNLSLTEEEKEEVNTQAKDLQSKIGEEEMKSMEIMDSDIEDVIKYGVLSQKLYLEVTKDFEVDEEEFEKFFKENKDFLKKVKIKRILLKTHKLKDGKLVPLSEEEQENAKQKAEEVLKRAKEGEDFGSLVQEYSQDEVSLPNNGEYTFGKNQGMGEKLENAAFSLKAGQLSDIVETEYGYNIIKLEEEIEPDKESTKNGYFELKKQSFYQSQVEEWMDNATVEINQEVWDAIKIK